jgi:L-alanine-DL-glutamate epimerase-like enolase superfamily enzyme
MVVVRVQAGDKTGLGWTYGRNAGRPGVAATAMSAVDVALWDLKSRLLGLRLARLLGLVAGTTAGSASDLNLPGVDGPTVQDAIRGDVARLVEVVQRVECSGWSGSTCGWRGRP